MADGGLTFYLAMAATAAGTAVSVVNTIENNKARELILEQELRSNELLALDEENQRLISLREANDDMLVRAGGIEAWSSPSLLAGRAFNFQMGMQDIANIRFNKLNSDAAISARIGILRSNSNATLVAGIFQIAGTAFVTADRRSLLKKEKEAAAAAAAGSKE